MGSQVSSEDDGTVQHQVVDAVVRAVDRVRRGQAHLHVDRSGDHHTALHAMVGQERVEGGAEFGFPRGVQGVDLLPSRGCTGGEQRPTASWVSFQ